MNNVIITLKNGEEISFKLRSQDCINLERINKVRTLDYLQDYSITAVINMLRFMRKHENEQFSENNACELYDKLIADGYYLEDIFDKIIYETAVASGLFKKEDLEAMREKKRNKKMELEKEV